MWNACAKFVSTLPKLYFDIQFVVTVRIISSNQLNLQQGVDSFHSFKSSLICFMQRSYLPGRNQVLPKYCYKKLYAKTLSRNHKTYRSTAFINPRVGPEEFPKWNLSFCRQGQADLFMGPRFIKSVGTHVFQNVCRKVSTERNQWYKVHTLSEEKNEVVTSGNTHVNNIPYSTSLETFHC